MPKHVLILPIIVISLILGITGGWLRLGWVEFPLSSAAVQHGLIMTGSFMGALISLERAIVMKTKWWLLVPILAVLAIPFYFLSLPKVSVYLLFGSSLGLTFLMYIQSLKVKEVSHFVITLGALCWAVGNALLLKSNFVPMVVPWWIAFLLFTIVGERLELSRFLPIKKVFIVIFWSLLVSLFFSYLIPFHFGGNILSGVITALIAIWLLKFDMAKISIRKKGEFRYIGLGLITGYVWLLIHALVMVCLEDHPLYYDLWIHSFFLGFAFSMIWAHAPIIFPAVIKVKRLIYHPVLYIPWALFQMTLMGRVVFSLTRNADLRQFFGVLNGWIILLMFAFMGFSYFMNYRTSIKKTNNIHFESN